MISIHCPLQTKNIELIKIAMSFMNDQDKSNMLSTNLEYMQEDLKVLIGKHERPNIDFEIKICQKTAARNAVRDSLISNVLRYFFNHIYSRRQLTTYVWPFTV